MSIVLYNDDSIIKIKNKFIVVLDSPNKQINKFIFAFISVYFLNFKTDHFNLHIWTH